MIARLWHGRTHSDHTTAYLDYVERTGLTTLRATPGNRLAVTLHRTEGDVTHYLVLSLWDTLDAIVAFAGADIQRARYFPEDDDYLLEREPIVTHYDIAGDLGALG